MDVKTNENWALKVNFCFEKKIFLTGVKIFYPHLFNLTRIDVVCGSAFQNFQPNNPQSDNGLLQIQRRTSSIKKFRVEMMNNLFRTSENLRPITVFLKSHFEGVIQSGLL